MSHDLKIRARILDVAREQFFSFGFTSVTMEHIADLLGMSKKTLYQYFPSKDDLLGEITAATMRDCNCKTEDILNDASLDFVEKLKSLMNFLMTQYSKMSPALMQDLQRSAPELWKKVDEFRHECIMNDFGKLVDEGIEKGVFRRDVDGKLVLLIYRSAVEALINPGVLAELPYTALQVFDAIAKVVFEGTLTEEARPQYIPGHSVVEND